MIVVPRRLFSHQPRILLSFAKNMSTTTPIAPAPAQSNRAAKKAGKKAASAAVAPKSPYEHTLRLPSTAFPMRPDAAARALLTKRTSTGLYAHQRADASRVAANDSSADYVLHDGPPYANGSLHAGHALNKVLKDVVVRHQLLRGRRVHFVPGWDCHGLPIELKAVQAAQKQGRDPASLSAHEIRAAARALALDVVESQKKDFMELAVMADWDKPYRTLEPEYVARQLDVFNGMVAAGLMVRARKPVYWSPAAKSALAEAELEYKEDHRSTAAYVALPMVSAALKTASSSSLATWLAKNPTAASLLVWTTTPWTLPANMAAAVARTLDYVAVRSPDAAADAAAKVLVVAQARVEALVAAGVLPANHEVVATGTGADLVGATYQGLYQVDGVDETAHPRPVVFADHVTSDAGTGIVHTAPGHGHEDYGVGVKEGLVAVSPVDDAGLFDATVPEFLRGLAVQTAGTKAVLVDLASRALLVHKSTYVHKFPYDWRYKTPVLVRSTQQWFARLDTLRPAALSALEQVAMVPNAGRARLQSYVSDRAEWCVSRQRAWGVPIPALFHRETGEALLTTESVRHVADILKDQGTDAWWRPDADELFVPPSVPAAERALWVRGRDTLDVWFDSGSSWASVLDPATEQVADMYLEGSDQHRGWFQSSLLTSVAVREKAPYRTILTHGFVVDENKQKMSKSLGNTITATQIVHGGDNKKAHPACGVDGLRMWVSMCEYTRDVALGPTVLGTAVDAARKLRNTVRFLLGNLDGYVAPLDAPAVALEPVDRYVLHRVSELATVADDAYAQYSFAKVVQALGVFSNATLSAVYFEAIKDRLYAEPVGSPSRLAAQYTLAQVLEFYTQTFAPLVPLLAEEVYDHGAHVVGTAGGDAGYFAGRRYRSAPAAWKDDALMADLEKCMAVRDAANQALESLRREKAIRANLEADLYVTSTDPAVVAFMGPYAHTLQALTVVSRAHVAAELPTLSTESSPSASEVVQVAGLGSVTVTARPAQGHKCPRCWQFTAPAADAVCVRCTAVLAVIAN
ncbi:tRNA synthetases class I-domain-containing protein [Blastocladiella britannica]|nr:tRNA synthetases class I-domain-containing protein [Blastocladiella britannica]